MFRGITQRMFGGPRGALDVVVSGHPVLRKRAGLIPPPTIATAQVQNTIDSMIATMRRYGGCGLAAPQIAVSQQIFVMEMTADMVASEAVLRDPNLLNMSVLPLTVIINPIVALSGRKVTHREGCLSIPEYSAFVPRSLYAKVIGLDHRGNQVEIAATGWTARIIQHEMDHLNGCLYADCMLCNTFANDNVRLQFKPTEMDIRLDGAKVLPTQS